MVATTGTSGASLRERGNAAYKAENWGEAINLYSQAIEADWESKDAEHLCALFSNRAAAHLKRCEVAYARLDVEVAIRLRPNWSRAWQRNAEVQKGLRQWKSASQSYREAAHFSKPLNTATPDYAAKNKAYNDYITLAVEMSKKAEAAPCGCGPVRPRDPYAYSARTVKASQANPEKHTMARVIVNAKTAAWKGWEDIMRDYDAGSPPSSLAGLWKVCDAFFALPEAAQFQTPPRGDLIAVNQCLTAMTVQETQIMARFGSTGDSPVVEARAMAAFVKSQTSAPELQSSITILNRYEDMLMLVETLLVHLPDLNTGPLGDEIDLRLLQAKLAMLDIYRIELEFEGKMRRTMVEEWCRLSEECVDQIVRRTKSKAASNDRLYQYMRRDRPLAKALLAQSMSLRLRAQFEENCHHRYRNVGWLNKGMLKAASALAQKAAELSVEDDIIKSQALETSLRCEILAGGVSVRHICDKLAAIERSRIPVETAFGPFDEHVRDSVHNQTFMVQCQEQIIGCREDLAPLPGQVISFEEGHGGLIDMNVKQPATFFAESQEDMDPEELASVATQYNEEEDGLLFFAFEQPVLA